MAPCTLKPGDGDEHVTGDSTSPLASVTPVSTASAGSGQPGVTRPNVETRSATRWAAGCSGRIRAGVVMGRIYPGRRSPDVRCGAAHHVVGKSVPVVPDGATPSSLSVYPATSLNTGAATVPP